jgi:hypothetical protein
MSRREAEEELLLSLQEAAEQVHSHDVMSLKEIAQHLKPSFLSLPQDRGKISSSEMRYLVHSHFLKVHGWLVRGLEPVHHENAANGSAVHDAAIRVQDKIPFFFDSIFDSQGGKKGFELSDVVLVVALLDNIFLEEGITALEAAYHVNGFSPTDQLDAEQLDKVFKSYLLIFAVGNRKTMWNATQHFKQQKGIKKMWPGWYDREAMVKDLHRNRAYQISSAANPFAARQFSFEESVHVMAVVSRGFGEVHETECQDLKEGLSGLDVSGTGRVPLKQFWAKKRIGYWHLHESTEYLRRLGALDESSARGPQVIIPNYVTAVSNCDAASDYFAICCRHECEEILDKLEGKIASPSATPARILQLVKDISSPTIAAPRTLNSNLEKALEDAGALHGGMVQLHGRLFAQWLHYAFPYECPYPHMSRTHKPLTPSQLQSQAGFKLSVTKEEINATAQAEVDEAIDDELSMWTLDEEMKTGETKHKEYDSWGLISVVHILAGVAVLSSLARSGMKVACDWLNAGGPEKPFGMNVKSHLV